MLTSLSEHRRTRDLHRARESRGLYGPRRLSTTSPNVERTRCNPSRSLFVHETQIAIWNCHFHFLGFARIEMQPSESSQRSQRRSLFSRMRQINLHHLICSHLASVLYVHARGKIVLCPNGSLVEGQIAVLKIRIAQSIPESIKRLAGKLTIGATLHVVVVECW